MYYKQLRNKYLYFSLRCNRSRIYLVVIIFSFTLAIYMSKLFGFRETTNYNTVLVAKTPNSSYINKILIWNLEHPRIGSVLGRLLSLKEIRNMTKDIRSFTNDCMELGHRTVNNEEFHCQFSTNHDEINQADVVVFGMLFNGFNMSDFPKVSDRNPNQLWVWYTREPPPIIRWRDPLINIFNWTMSYRTDSDVWTPYGKKIYGTLGNNLNSSFIGSSTLHEWIQGKSKLAVGVISRCKTESQRENVISKMNKIEKIDIFGDCGQPACGRNSRNCTGFWRALAKQYKFYLAFENSLCTDYITEKFWRALELGIVPVVYGAGNYIQEAPPHSYVNVKDFDPPHMVMYYLQELSDNVGEYSKYFEWRKSYAIRKNGGMSYDWCDLCKAVQEHKRKPKPNQTYRNLQFWWEHQPGFTKLACYNNPLRLKSNSSKLTTKKYRAQEMKRKQKP